MTDEQQEAKASVKERLQATAMACLESYDAWDQDKKDVTKREALQEAVHELRKVASRLEIDIAISERDGQSKSLPIPSHRSAPKGKNNNDDGGKVEKRPQRSRKTATKKPAAE